MKEGTSAQFRYCLDLRHFLKFKKNYPFYPCLVVGVKRVCVFCFAKALRTLPTIRFSNSTSGV